MIKTLTNLFKQDKEKFVVPKGVQDVIPVAAIFDDGIFKVGKDKYSKTYRFTDINYAVASREDKEATVSYTHLWAIAVAVKKIILFGLVRKTWRKYTSLSVPLTCYPMPRLRS